MDYSEIDALMKSDDSSARRMAASMLSETGDGPATVERLVELLKMQTERTDASESALMFIGGRKNVEKVAPLVGVTDTGMRIAL
jgi:HEAT repeat protein